MLLGLLPALAVLGGCYFCPLPGGELSSQQFLSWKLGEEVLAKEWTPIGSYVLFQEIDLSNSIVSFNALMPEEVIKAKLKVRYTVRDELGVQRFRQTVTMKILSSGELNSIPERTFGADHIYRAGDEVFVEAWSSKRLVKNLAIAFQYNVVSSLLREEAVVSPGG